MYPEYLRNYWRDLIKFFLLEIGYFLKYDWRYAVDSILFFFFFAEGHEVHGYIQASYTPSKIDSTMSYYGRNFVP